MLASLPLGASPTPGASAAADPSFLSTSADTSVPAARAGQETPLVKEVERETEAGWGGCWVEGVLVFSAGWSEVIDS